MLQDSVKNGGNAAKKLSGTAGFFCFALGVSMPGLIFKSRIASVLTGAG
jgi:hypothetical protein